MTQNTLYYSRVETESEIIIKWKPFSTYGPFLFLLLGYISAQGHSLSHNSIFAVLSVMSFIGLILNTIICLISTNSVSIEARKAQQNGNCRLEGSKLSLKNPLTLHIYK